MSFSRLFSRLHLPSMSLIVGYHAPDIPFLIKEEASRCKVHPPKLRKRRALQRRGNPQNEIFCTGRDGGTHTNRFVLERVRISELGSRLLLETPSTTVIRILRAPVVPFSSST